MKLCGSEVGIRKTLLGCECGVVGKVFLSNGEFFTGHFCKVASRWTNKPLNGVTSKDILELFEKKHQIGPG